MSDHLTFGTTDSLRAVSPDDPEERLWLAQHFAAKDAIEQLLSADRVRALPAEVQGGVRLFEYERTMLHAKIMTVDRSWATVGSTNMDNRSLAINDELNFSVFDPQVVAELDDQFEADTGDSREVDLRQWRQRPVLTRAKELASGAVRQEL